MTGELQDFPFVGVVRRVRRIADMSQRELGRAVGMASSTIARIEAGSLVPSLATLLRILSVAGLHLVVVDGDGRVVAPMQVWDDRTDGAGRAFPAHLDTILDPEWGEWWADIYGLTSPPETFHLNRRYRNDKRRLSQWQVRVKKHRNDPKPLDPDCPLWREMYGSRGE